jgi:hydrogenase maturation protease
MEKKATTRQEGGVAKEREGASPPRPFAPSPRRVLLLGLGNPYLTDDGVGVRVAMEVKARLEESQPVLASRSNADTPPHSLIGYAQSPADLTITECSVGGLTLMENMVGYDRVILVDAIQTQNSPPGAIHRLTLDDLRAISPTQHAASPHDASLITALEAGKHLGMTLPEEVVIYAVEVENTLDFSEQPTPAVAEAIPQVIALVLDEICQ